MAEHPDPIPGELLRLWRQSHRLSAERVARAVGVSRRRIRQWEAGAHGASGPAVHGRDYPPRAVPMMTPADREAAIRTAVDALVTAILAAVTPEPADAPDRLLDVGSAAAALGVGRSRLYDEIGAGRLRSLVVGRRRLVPAGAIADYIRAGVNAAPVRPVLSRREGRAASGATPPGRPARRRPDPKAAA